MRGSGKFCSSFWSPTKFISVTFIFPWWPVYGKWQRIRLHSCLEQPQTRLCAGSHAGFLLFLGCAGGGILLTLREEYLFSSIPMESFSICSAAHQRSSFFFQMAQCWQWIQSKTFAQCPFCWAGSRVGFMTGQQDGHVHPAPASLQSREPGWLVRMLSQELPRRSATARLCVLAVATPL